jgi:nicotinamidase-related amidase
MTHTALLIVDVQEGFVKGGPNGISSDIEALQGEYRYVAASRFINRDHSPFRRLIGFFGLGSDSSEIALAFQPEAHVFVFDKYFYSCLVPEFQRWLARNDISTVHVVGLRTENCVLKTAVDLFESNIYTPVVLTAYCSSPYPALHKAACDILPTFIGNRQVRKDA